MSCSAGDRLKSSLSAAMISIVAEEIEVLDLTGVLAVKSGPGYVLNIAVCMANPQLVLALEIISKDFMKEFEVRVQQKLEQRPASDAQKARSEYRHAT